MRPAPAADCCPPVLAGTMTAEEAEAAAARFSALADPVRLRLLHLVATAEAGEACACDLTEPVGRSQPTVSHHLKVLLEAGLVTREQRGRWAWYRADRAALAEVAAALVPQPAPA